MKKYVSNNIDDFKGMNFEYQINEEIQVSIEYEFFMLFFQMKLSIIFLVNQIIIMQKF